MPKKQRNSFYFFMKEIQEMRSQQGRCISMKQLADECHSLFKNLTPEHREKYEEMAKDYKNQTKDSIEGHLCSDGTVLAFNNQAEAEKRETLENKIRAVKNMVFKNGSLEEVVEKDFYIICFNVLCRTDEDEFIPNEVGIVRYSLKRGLQEHYHCFIDPCRIPLGYTHASKQHSDDTHLIPISGFALAKRDHRTIYKEILDFVNPTNKRVAPVFVLQESLEQNQGCLQWLSWKAGGLEDGPIHVYDIACLLMELRAFAGKAFPSRAVVVDILSNNSFDYIPNTRCSYHEELDNAHCALGYAKRLCFILSDALCGLYDVECTQKHLPPRVSDGQTEAAQPIFPPSRVFIPPKLPKQYVNLSQVSNTTTVGDTPSTVNSVDQGQSWIKEFHQPQPDVGTGIPSQNNAKPAIYKEMRQPFTVPLVLNQALCQSKTQYALLGRGRGIGRGKPPSVN